MKPAPFDYYSPSTTQEALALLAEHDGEAKVLAGGQSLVPSMNFRLAQPSILVDLNGVAELFGIEPAEDGGLTIGAMTRQRTVERSSLVAERAPLIAAVMPFIAHPQIRNRGTIGGSLAHADPASELPAVALALGAQLKAQSSRGVRVVDAADFFLGLFTTALEPDEILTEISIPALPAGTGTAFAEFARRHGDYALAGVCATLSLTEDNTVSALRLVLFSVADAPLLSGAAATVLAGVEPTAEAIDAAVQALQDDIDPQADIHATSDYRRHLAGVLARRTITEAAERARISTLKGK